MRDYAKLYETDSRYKRYVDANCAEYDLTKEEVLRMKIIQNVGDMYATTPVKEYKESVDKAKETVGTVTVVNCGGC